MMIWKLLLIAAMLTNPARPVDIRDKTMIMRRYDLTSTVMRLYGVPGWHNAADMIMKDIIRGAENLDGNIWSKDEDEVVNVDAYREWLKAANSVAR